MLVEYDADADGDNVADSIACPDGVDENDAEIETSGVIVIDDIAEKDDDGEVLAPELEEDLAVAETEASLEILAENDDDGVVELPALDDNVMVGDTDASIEAIEENDAGALEDTEATADSEACDVSEDMGETLGEADGVPIREYCGEVLELEDAVADIEGVEERLDDDDGEMLSEGVVDVLVEGVGKLAMHLFSLLIFEHVPLSESDRSQHIFPHTTLFDSY